MDSSLTVFTCLLKLKLVSHCLHFYKLLILCIKVLQASLSCLLSCTRIKLLLLLASLLQMPSSHGWQNHGKNWQVTFFYFFIYFLVNVASRHVCTRCCRATNFLHHAAFGRWQCCQKHPIQVHRIGQHLNCIMHTVVVELDSP